MDKRTAMEKIMDKYVYQKKKLRISRYRRKENGSPDGSKTKGADTDRRHEKVRDGIILKDYDRREDADAPYNGEEKRSGTDRRSGKDRRG